MSSRAEWGSGVIVSPALWVRLRELVVVEGVVLCVVEGLVATVLVQGFTDGVRVERR